jgi:hypothetical protein
MDIMAQSGSQAGYSSVRDLGITALSISTDTWIITSTIARATTDQCQGAASIRRSTVRNFTARQCTTRMGTKLPGDTSSTHFTPVPAETRAQAVSVKLRPDNGVIGGALHLARLHVDCRGSASLR